MPGQNIINKVKQHAVHKTDGEQNGQVALEAVRAAAQTENQTRVAEGRDRSDVKQMSYHLIIKHFLLRYFLMNPKVYPVSEFPPPRVAWGPALANSLLHSMFHFTVEMTTCKTAGCIFLIRCGFIR